jgi:hypothetical protein
LTVSGHFLTKNAFFSGIIIASLVNRIDMRAFYGHRALNSLFLTAFLIYAVSPLFSHVEEKKDLPLGGRGGNSGAVKKLLIVDLLFDSFLSNDCGAADEAGDTYVLVKKRRAAIKRLDAVDPPSAVAVLHEIPDGTPVEPVVDFVRVDHKANPKESKGFLPKYSGLSPPSA